MKFQDLSQADKNYIRANLKKLNIFFNYKDTKLKRCDGRVKTYRTADIRKRHIERAINLIEQSDHKQANGYCKILIDRTTVKRLKEYKEMLDD